MARLRTGALVELSPRNTSSRHLAKRASATTSDVAATEFGSIQLQSGAISGVGNFAPKLVGRLVAGEDDSRIDVLLDDLLSLPVVPAIKAILAARTDDETWRRTLAPLDAVSAVEALAIFATIARSIA